MTWPLSPLARGLTLIHVAGAPIAGQQGCAACHQAFPVPWWPPGARVVCTGDGFWAGADDTATDGQVLCAGAN